MSAVAGGSLRLGTGERRRLMARAVPEWPPTLMVFPPVAAEELLVLPVPSDERNELAFPCLEEAPVAELPKRL